MSDDYEQMLEATAEASREWRARWPHCCSACGGWGGRTHYEHHPYGMTTATETLWEPCETCVLAGICPRCGAEGEADEDDGLVRCETCGWDENCEGDPGF